MEVPAEVFVHNQLLGLKGGRGTLLRISSDGYYELNLTFGERLHRVLLPIEGTVLIGQEAEPAVNPDFEIER